MTTQSSTFTFCLSVFCMGILQVGCSKTNTPPCQCVTNFPLPQPQKIVRAGSGFTPVTFSLEIDLSTGSADYQRKNKLDDLDSCSGNLVIDDGIEAWREASTIAACTGVLDKPISDGFVDTLTLYYPASTVLPTGIETKSSGEWTTVELLEGFSNSVQGKQQFDCSGQFAIDALIKQKFECLQVN